uniref:CHIP6 n=1 Tax=Ganoderma boninense TaxID=34458 RepID=A0A5K1K3H2_9APHY
MVPETTSNAGPAHATIGDADPPLKSSTDIPGYDEFVFDNLTPLRRSAKVPAFFFLFVTKTYQLTTSVQKSQNDYQREYLDLQDEYIYRRLMCEAPPEDGVASCGHLPASWSHPLHRIEFWEGSYFRPAWLRQVGIQLHCGHGGAACPQLGTYDSGPGTPSLPSLDSARPGPAPVQLPFFSHAPDDLDNPPEATEDEEIPYLIEEEDSDFEDEDADLHPADRDGRLLPNLTDLPWVGEATCRADPSVPASDATFRNDRLVVVVDIEGIHELPFTFCMCPNAAPEDIQLLELGYYPASSTRPKTVFTTRVLDDFLLANRECKTSTRNYYNKLRRVTNPALPHMVPDRYKELLRVSRQWRVQQMRMSAGFGHRQDEIGPGGLAVQCPTCPRPGVNLPEGWEKDEQTWKYTRSVVMDGNFSAQHRKMRNPDDDVPLADGHAFMVKDLPYKEHLKTAKEYNEVLNPLAMTTAPCLRQLLNGRSWRRPESEPLRVQGTASSVLMPALTFNKANATILIRKWKRACKEWGPAVTAFEELSEASDQETLQRWTAEAKVADTGREGDPACMDIYDVDANPVPTRKEVQLMLGGQELNAGEGGLGAADWIASGLRIEETKIGIAYTARRVVSTSGTQARLSLVQQRQKVASAISAFHRVGVRHMPGRMPGDGGDIRSDTTDFGIQWDEERDDQNVPQEGSDFPADQPESHPIALPSTFGARFLRLHGFEDLMKKERQLREGQMNDALQGIRTGIGYKSLLYRAKVRNASSYRARLRSFDDVHVADEGVRKHVRIYMQSRAAMDRLFDSDVPEDQQELHTVRLRYREIKKEDLRASTAVLEAFTPGLRNEHSAWFWNVSDTETGAESAWTQQCGYILVALYALRGPPS